MSILDKNECLNPSHNNCHQHGLCENTQGSYNCRCKSGYVGNGRSNCTGLYDYSYGLSSIIMLFLSTLSKIYLSFITDINECLNSNSCPANAICTNTPGSYSCRCKPGYQWNNGQCKGKVIFHSRFKI